MLKAEAIHHVSIPVTTLERSKEFYGTVLGLTEIERPPSQNRGAWYRLGEHQIHLIEGEDPTFRVGKGIDDQDVHVAIRVSSYSETKRLLHKSGFHPKANDDHKRTIEIPRGDVCWSRCFVMDPDGNVIELMAEF
jgi:catechol 2,3-dioxygenase-like lactoylglutathione lyase family enzyme